MRRLALPLIAAVLCGMLASCDDPNPAVPRAAQALPVDAVGHYCGMIVAEHPGPKGQILLRSREQPVWFSSARDALAFTLLPEEPRDIAAIYVSDMASAASWDAPGAANWIDARRAVFVIGSSMRGGMGAEEAVPFAARDAAERFAAEHGGRVVAFDAIPRDYVLGGEAPPAAAAPAANGGAHRH